MLGQLKNTFIEGFIISAFDIGLIIGMSTLVYIAYEELKYEPSDKK